MYSLLLFLHILSAIVWLGGAMFSEALVAMSRRRGEDAYARTWTAIADTGARVYPVATIVLIGTALAMVFQRWSFGTLWIDVALGLFVVTFTLGIGFFSPQGKKISRDLEAGGDVSSLVPRIRRVHMIQRLDIVVLLTILVLMVYKPT